MNLPTVVLACSRCPNDTRNPIIDVHGGLCRLCQQFDHHYNPADLVREREFVQDLRGTGAGRHDAMVGVSGGKDSTAALAQVIELGFTPLAFTLDTGYYPAHIVPRARAAGRQAGRGPRNHRPSAARAA